MERADRLICTRPTDKVKVIHGRANGQHEIVMARIAWGVL